MTGVGAAQAASQLGATWTLAYTANSELLSILNLDRIPGVTVGPIVQDINSAAGTFVNRVSLSSSSSFMVPAD